MISPDKIEARAKPVAGSDAFWIAHEPFAGMPAGRISQGPFVGSFAAVDWLLKL